MRVESLELFWIRMPLVGQFTTSFGTTTEREILLVKVNADGASGWGESGADGLPACRSRSWRRRISRAGPTMPASCGKTSPVALQIGGLEYDRRRSQTKCVRPITFESLLCSQRIEQRFAYRTSTRRGRGMRPLMGLKSRLCFAVWARRLASVRL